MKRTCASPFCEVEFEARVHNKKYHTGQCKRDAENVTKRRSVSTEEALQQEAEVVRVPDVTAEEQVAYLRAMNQRLYRENQKLKIEKKEQVETIYATVRQHLNENPTRTIPRPKTPSTKRKVETKAETACAVLSDWQLGKKTIDYNTDVCETRVADYMSKLQRITDIQRHDHDVPDLRLWVLGDMLEGEMIFPGQAHHIDVSLHTQIMRTAEVLSKKVVTPALENFDKVKFVGISGNHGAIGGRARLDMHPETNADRMIYNIVRMIHEGDKRIEWDIPEGIHEGDFYTIDTIGDKNYLLFHGHQISGSGSHTAIEKRIKNWAMGAIKEKFDYALMGHFHNPTRLTINNCTAYINGTTESSNGWAVEVMGACGSPCQYLLFAHPDHGVTAEYPIYL